jgi:hypothetical protein
MYVLHVDEALLVRDRGDVALGGVVKEARHGDGAL